MTYRIKRIGHSSKYKGIKDGVLCSNPPLPMSHERIEHCELTSSIVTEVSRIHKKQIWQPTGEKSNCNSHSHLI